MLALIRRSDSELPCSSYPPRSLYSKNSRVVVRALKSLLKPNAGAVFGDPLLGFAL